MNWIKFSNRLAVNANPIAINPHRIVNPFVQFTSLCSVRFEEKNRLNISIVVVQESALSSADIDDIAAHRITAIKSPINPFGK